MDSPDWLPRLKELAQDLTSLEVNTIESIGMTGRKMPAWPHALIDIAQKYADFLTGPGIGLNLDAFKHDFDTLSSNGEERTLYIWSENHFTPEISDETKFLLEYYEIRTKIKASGEIIVQFSVIKDPADEDSKEKVTNAKAILESMDATRHAFRNLRPTKKDGSSYYNFAMDTGPETFHLLRWAAANLVEVQKNRGSQAQTPFPEISSANIPVLKRIQRTCDDLKARVEILKKGNTEPCIGCTRAELIKLYHQKIAPPIPPDTLTRIRKAWDIGADRIVLQTVLQMDGDVIFRAGREFVASDTKSSTVSHDRIVGIAVSHWNNLFALLISLLGGRDARVFDAGNDSRRDGGGES